MGRLIDADKMLEELEEFSMHITGSHHHNFIVSQCKNSIKRIIDEQPTVDVPDINVGDWIPIEDTSNIPEERKVYLVTYVTHLGRRYVRSVECSYSGETPRHIEWSKRINGTVTAYMSLPEPYKPEGEKP